MNLTREMRKKYQKRLRQFGGDTWDCYPPGGADVMLLCELADDLLEIVRWTQRELPVAQQQEVEKKLWLREKDRSARRCRRLGPHATRGRGAARAWRERMMAVYTPQEGDVLELTRQARRYIVVDRVTETTCYCRRVDSRGGLLAAVQMPVAQFVRLVHREEVIEWQRWQPSFPPQIFSTT